MGGGSFVLVAAGVYFFFFKQKTAYEMRISDWSSDVCSSDLDAIMAALRSGKILAPIEHDPGHRQDGKGDLNKLALAVWRHAEPFAGTLADRYRSEERRVGQEWSVRVDLGGRRIIKKKTT